MKRLGRLERIRELIRMKEAEYTNFIAADILNEIDHACSYEISEEETLELLEMLTDIYFNVDYSTPIGLGVVAGDWIERKLDDDEELIIDRDEFLDFYSMSDWQ